MAKLRSHDPFPGRLFHSFPADRLLYFVLACYGVLSLVALALAPTRFLPAEDAVILFQYSRNLAQHGSISYLANGPHVEGATDFGWMVLLAAAFKLHIPMFWFCAVANISCLLVLGMLLLALSSQAITPIRLLAVAGAISLMPQILAAASGFAVLPDAVLLTALVLAVTQKRPAAAAILAFIFCLFRPEGVVFAVPLLLSMIFSRGTRSRNAVLIFAFFILPGALYFVWRWRYFGELFPLPFLVKSDTHRVLGLLVLRSVHQSLSYLLFATLLCLPLFLRKARIRHIWLLVPLVACPTVFYWSMRLDQNVAARLFYYLPLSAAILIALNWPEEISHRIVIFRTGVAAWLLLLAMPLVREVRTYRDEQFGNVKDIATELSRLPVRGGMVTSEAGFLPYFSNWTTYDAWGLNTPQFAHRLIRPDDIVRLNPDLVVFHPDKADTCVADPSWPGYYADRSWPHMTRNLLMGAPAPQYELWLTSYGSDYYRRRNHWRYGEGDRECWLVRKSSPLSSGIVKILLAHHAVPPNASAELEGER